MKDGCWDGASTQGAGAYYKVGLQLCRVLCFEPRRCKEFRRSFAGNQDDLGQEERIYAPVAPYSHFWIRWDKLAAAARTSSFRIRPWRRRRRREGEVSGRPKAARDGTPHPPITNSSDGIRVVLFRPLSCFPSRDEAGPRLSRLAGETSSSILDCWPTYRYMAAQLPKARRGGVAGHAGQGEDVA